MSSISKQEKIRGGIEHLLATFTGEGDFTTELLDYLHSQGVVVRVKCPDCEWGLFVDGAIGMTPCYSCNSTGYIIEPLIEEK